jgi:WD40 repeat protein
MVPARQVAAVDVDGRRVALATPDPLRDSTLVEVFDPAAQRMVQQATFEGMVQPEAFSPDGSRIYATRSYDSYYRVIVLDLATGRSDPTLGPDKTADPEDMYGSVVQASLSPDKNQLATLYRDSVRPDHTAFVHLLSLSTGTTVCVDLEAPFGVDDGRGTDRLAWLDSATVAIGHVPESGDSVVASFSASDIWTGAPQPHYHALVRTGIDPPELPVGVLDVAGYKRFIAIVDN